MTDMQDQIPSIVSDSKAKRPVVRYIVLNVALFLGYYAFMLWATYMIAPLVPGWDECVSEILFRLPTGYLAYRLLKRARPVENPRMIGKKRFRKFQLLYLLLVQLPIKIPSAMFAAGGEWLPQTTGSYMVNAYVLGPLVEEVVFRGMFYGLARRKLDFWPAAILNGVLFALIHYGKPYTMLVTFLMAVLFCQLYEMTGTIKYGIVLHYTFNLLSFPVFLIMDLVPRFVSVPLMAVAIILHIILIIRKDKLEAALFA